MNSIKNLVILFLLIASVASAQIGFQGVAFNSVITNHISGGGSILWDDQFDELSTSTWAIRDNLNGTPGIIEIRSGQLYMQAAATTMGGPPDGIGVTRIVTGDFTATVKTTMPVNQTLTDGYGISGIGMLVTDPTCIYNTTLWKRWDGVSAEKTYRMDNAPGGFAGAASDTSGADRWMRIQRVGDHMHTFDSDDGATWHEKMPGMAHWHPSCSSLLLNLFVSEYDDTEISTGTFDYCTITFP